MSDDAAGGDLVDDLDDGPVDDAADDPVGRRWRTMAVGAAVVLVAWIGLVASWDEAPYTLTFDDAYYFLEIGQNVADGHGFTFDRINETNGFMPLWQLVTIPAFAVGLEGETALRVLLVVQLLLWAAAAVVLARTLAIADPGPARLAAAGRPRAPALVTAVGTLAFAGLVGSPYVLRALPSGLESGITDLLYALLLAAAVRHRGDLVGSTTTRQRLGLSVLLSLLFLGRTDVLVLLGVLGLWSLVELRGTSGGLRRLIELFALPALVVSGYLVINQLVFGVPVQISGVVKRVDPGVGDLALLAVFAGVALLAAVRSWRRRAALTGDGAADERFPRIAAIWTSTGWFVAFLVLATGYYAVLSAQQWLWYFAPHVVYLVLLGGALVLDFAEAALAEARRRHSDLRALAPVLLVVVLPLLGSIPVQWRAFADPDLRSIQIANRDAGRWISANLPDDAVLASWDAGVVGYFSDQSVVNLDGVVNSVDWYRAMRDGTTAEFLEAEGVEYLVNHAGLVDGEEPEVQDKVDRLFGPGADAVQVARFEFDYSGRFEGQSGSAGTQRLAVFVHRIERADP